MTQAHDRPDTTRRAMLQGMAALGACSLFAWPRLSWAALPGDRRLLVIVLRGAMDGLGAVPAIGDRDYHDARGAMAYAGAGLLPLDGFFALHPALGPLQALYAQKEMLVLHAAATPYRERSHFDAQDLLENGGSQPHAYKTGWLGRATDALGGKLQSLAVGPAVPLILQGESTMAENWSPSILAEPDGDFMSRIAYMYAKDPILSHTTNALPPEVRDPAQAGDNGAKRQQFVEMMTATAGFMAADDGARIASIDLDGWDTHAGQGLETGRLAQALKNLAEGIDAFRRGMGDKWSDTAVLAITEFGRTVAANGTGGTDHGTASAAFLAGGNVNGGRVIGDWPGLAAAKLYQGRDLYPANDLRRLAKAVLRDHMRLGSAAIESRVFPGSMTTVTYEGLFRA